MPDDTQPAKTPPSRTRVFLSYSRKDDAFTRRLAAVLERRGYAPDFDQSARDPANAGIAPEDEWWPRLKDMIAANEVMVFIVSPDSAASRVCGEEIAYARALAKRIIPVLRRPVDFKTVPPQLSALNVRIDFTDDAAPAFAAALDALCAALDLDVAWHRESARLTLLAQRWDKAGRPDDLLLTAADVRAVGTLLERRPAMAPEPSEVMVALRDASRVRLDAEDVRQRRIIGRAFVKPAEEALKAGRGDGAVRLGATGALLARDLGFDPDVGTRLWEPARCAILESRTCAVLKGHTGAIRAAAFSPDGRRVVTGSDDTDARIWDSATGQQIAVLQGHRGSVWSALFSADGGRIVTASNESTARIWNAVTGQQIAALKGHGGSGARSAVFSPNGARIVTASDDDNMARVWDAATGRQIVTLEGHSGSVTNAVFSPDGARIMTTSHDNSTRIWDATTGQQIATVGGGRRRAAFSPDGAHVVTTSFKDNIARVWDAATGEQVATLQGHTDSVWDATFNPLGSAIVTASSDCSARVWDAATGRQTAALQGHTGSINAAAFSPDGTRIVTASSDNSARFWDALTGQQIAALHGHTSLVECAVFSPDGARIVTASSDNSARIWDATTSQQIAILGEGCLRAAFSANGARIVTSSYKKNVARLWDAATGQHVAALQGHTDGVWSAEFSPDGARIVTASSDRSARVWDAATGQQIAVLEGHVDLGGRAEPVTDAKFSPDGARIVTAFHGSARIWDAARCRQIAKLHGVPADSAAFSPDGTRVVTASYDNSARIWDAVTGQLMVALQGHTELVKSAEFTPDGTRIVTASSDGTARVWDAVTGQQIVALQGHSRAVNSAVFSPDGTHIVTGSSDESARVWNAVTGQQTAALRHAESVHSAKFSPDGTCIVTVTVPHSSRHPHLNHIARVWDATTGQQIAALEGYGRQLLGAVFSPDGQRLLTTYSEVACIWDISRIATVMGRAPSIVLAAALARGIGLRTDAERADLLMQDAPDDLYAEALRELGRGADDPEIAEIAARLRAPLHPNCYLSPTQFAERFGLPPPGRAGGETAPAGTVADGASEMPLEAVGAAPPDGEAPSRDKLTSAPPGRTMGSAPASAGALETPTPWRGSPLVVGALVALLLAAALSAAALALLR